MLFLVLCLCISLLGVNKGLFLTVNEITYLLIYSMEQSPS